MVTVSLVEARRHQHVIETFLKPAVSAGGLGPDLGGGFSHRKPFDAGKEEASPMFSRVTLLPQTLGIEFLSGRRSNNC